jgi:hypothetical protein
MNPWLIAAMIVVGALAYRGASYIFSQIRRGDSARLAVMFSQNPGRHFLTFYVIVGLPLAFINGFLLRLSWIDSVIVGVGTWIGMLVSTAVARRFNPVLQFFFFGTISLLWLAADLILAVSRNGPD